MLRPLLNIEKLVADIIIEMVVVPKEASILVSKEMATSQGPAYTRGSLFSLRSHFQMVNHSALQWFPKLPKFPNMQEKIKKERKMQEKTMQSKVMFHVHD